MKKAWILKGKLTRVRITEAFVELHVLHHEIVRNERSQLSKEIIQKAMSFVDKDVEIQGYEHKNIHDAELDKWLPCETNSIWFDIREWDKEKFLQEYYEDKGFFRDTDIPYEGLTDDEKEGW